MKNKRGRDKYLQFQNLIQVEGEEGGGGGGGGD